MLRSLIGIGEIILLPLDVLKIKRQTNPEAFRGRGVFRIVADEGMGLYRGASWTAARNAPGSFAVRTAPPTTSNPYNYQTHILTPISSIAIRWLRLRQRKNLQSNRLQHRLLVPKLCRLHMWRVRLSHRLGSPRRHQDENTESEFREPRERVQDCREHVSE